MSHEWFIKNIFNIHSKLNKNFSFGNYFFENNWNKYNKKVNKIYEIYPWEGDKIKKKVLP